MRRRRRPRSSRGGRYDPDLQRAAVLSLQRRYVSRGDRNDGNEDHAGPRCSRPRGEVYPLLDHTQGNHRPGQPGSRRVHRRDDGGAPQAPDRLRGRVPLRVRWPGPALGQRASRRPCRWWSDYDGARCRLGAEASTPGVETPGPTGLRDRLDCGGCYPGMRLRPVRLRVDGVLFHADHDARQERLHAADILGIPANPADPRKCLDANAIGQRRRLPRADLSAADPRLPEDQWQDGVVRGQVPAGVRLDRRGDGPQRLARGRGRCAGQRDRLDAVCHRRQTVDGHDLGYLRDGPRAE